MNNLHYPYKNLEVGTFLLDLGKISETRELIPEFYHCLAATQFSSVQLLSHVTLCSPMNYSMPGLPLHHQLPESTQTHVH